MRRRLGRLGAVAILTVAASLLSATVGAAAESSSTTPSAISSTATVTYRVGVLEYVDSLNPFVGYTGVDYSVYHLIYDFLVGFEPQKLEPRAEYAESWSSSADGLTWTFKIRSGMTWQDGDPATARDAAFTFNYILDNRLSAFIGYLTSIKKVTAPDDTTLIIECSKPKADILQMKVPILPEHIWSKVSAKAAETSFRNGPSTVGSGPYQVVENKHDSYCRLVANPSYWGGKPAVDELIFESYQNADTMVQDLAAGALDAVDGVPAAQFRGLASDSITTNAAVSWSFEQLTFNCYDGADSRGNPVLRDPEFRRALQWAVDRETNAAVAYGGYMSPGTTLLPPYSAYAWQPTADETYSYNPAKARELLDAAGYKDADDDGYRETKAGKPLTLRLFSDAQTSQNVSTSKLVVGWFKDVGVRVKLQILDSGALVDVEVNYDGSRFAPDFDMIVWYWEGDAESPQFILSLLTSGQLAGWSDSSWTDSEYDKLFSQQATATDRATQVSVVQSMQQIAYAASPYIVFGYPQSLEAYNTSDWTGYVKVPGGYPDYDGEALGHDTYISVRPVVAGAATAEESSTTWVWVLVAAAVIVIAVAVAVLRGRRRAEVED